MPKSLDERFKERNFLPALKPRKWQARKAVFCRRLVDDEHETVPLVAYGWDSPDRTEFVTREAIADAGASKSRAHKYALRNLARRARKVKWNKQRYPMGRKKVAVAMVEGDEFTGSCVLVPEFLEAAHDLLDCDTLVIGIPNRFSLWACDAALAPLMVSFAEAQFEEAEEDEREPVTSALILSQNGKLAGIAVSEEASGRGRSSKTKERSTKTRRKKESSEDVREDSEEEVAPKRRKKKAPKKPAREKETKAKAPAKKKASKKKASTKPDPKAKKKGPAPRKKRRW